MFGVRCCQRSQLSISNYFRRFHIFPKKARFFSTTEQKEVSPQATRIGWIGTGVMGFHMCRHLIEQGYNASVYNRTLSKCDGLKEKGAVVCASPKEVAEKSDIVFTIVGYPNDVREVILGESGVLAGSKSGDIIVDMTTSEPSLAQEISEKAQEKSVSSVDAPVSGGDVGAKEARLSIMIGGDEGTVKKIDPLFQIMGGNINFMGPAGSGQHTKMVNQILIASNMVGVCEGLLYGHKAGLDLDDVIAAVGSGAAGSWSINNLGPRIVKRNFDPGFFVEHFLKDMGIALKECDRMGLSVPGLSLANQMYQAVRAQGHARLGTHALALALEHLNNIKH